MIYFHGVARPWFVKLAYGLPCLEENPFPFAPSNRVSRENSSDTRMCSFTLRNYIRFRSASA